MAGDIREFLARLPAAKRVDQATCEFLDKEIRNGAELNQLQREILLGVVQHAVEQNDFPPPPYESLVTHVYLEWNEEAKRSEEGKPKLIELVRKLKAQPNLAAAVAQLAQKVHQERETRRRRELERLAAAAESAGQATNSARKGGAADPPKVMVRRMQEARHGGGENAMANLDLAAQYADEAVEAYPGVPLVLFEAAGCHQLAAEKGTHHSLMDRYVHMKQAFSLYQQCLTILAVEPYVKLKGEYDGWRKGIAELLPRIQKKLEALEEKAEIKGGPPERG
jgi:hypothetical protein